MSSDFASRYAMRIERGEIDVDALKIDRMPIKFLRFFADGAVNLTNQRQKFSGCNTQVWGAALCSHLSIYTR